MATNIISRTDAAGLIPEPVTREIIQGVTESSAVLRMGRRLPNMTSRTQSMNVLDMLPMAYWVDGDTGVKQTTKMAWDRKKIYAEELAVIVPIPEAVLDDSDYDIWGEVRPRIVEAFGKKIDEAVLFGTEKPNSWRSDIVSTAVASGAVVAATDDVFNDILGVNGVIAKVEESGFLPTGAMSAVKMRAILRGLKDTSGQPVFKTDMQGATQYALDGVPMVFPKNGAFDPEKALMILGDFNQLVYSIRQDVTYKLLTEATIIDPATKAVVYSLAQQDMVALRAVMRLGWEIPNPINAFQPDDTKRAPFAVYSYPTGSVTAVTVSPATASVAAGASKQFRADVSGSGGVYDSGVTWSVSGTSAVKAGTAIDASGLLKVDAAETNTSLTVTATSKGNTSKTGTATVTVAG